MREAAVGVTVRAWLAAGHGSLVFCIERQRPAAWSLGAARPLDLLQRLQALKIEPKAHSSVQVWSRPPCMQELTIITQVAVAVGADQFTCTPVAASVPDRAMWSPTAAHLDGRLCHPSGDCKHLEAQLERRPDALRPDRDRVSARHELLHKDGGVAKPG